ncbi:hypothetical protein F5Y18DRAFT_155052 [Xylariaceae sp. FL1019]|nr:hypothetical protein F5Y18DRAFT_155052 [Xylariaceae sp. FL1019]
MQFRLPLLTFLTIPSLAAAAVMSTFASTEWTLQGLYRVCDSEDTSCTWTFRINTNEAGVDVTPCLYVVYSLMNGTNSTIPASQADGGPTTCGAFNITSGWSDQFGADQGFTTLSVVDYVNMLIVWAGYTDAIVANEALVSPDLSFPVQMLPM